MTDVPRTKALSLQQIMEIKQLRTEAEKAEHRVEYGLGEHDNPLLSIPADLYRYNPHLVDWLSMCSCMFPLRHAS